MRRLLNFTVFAMLIISVSGAAHAQQARGAPPPAAFSPNRSYVPPIRVPKVFLQRELSERLFALRQGAVAQREKDGGTLAPQSRADLQQKLDKIQSAYRRKLSRNTGYDVYVGGV